jgi:hypothetical protein
MLKLGFAEGRKKLLRIVDRGKKYQIACDGLVWASNSDTFKRVVICQDKELYLITSVKANPGWVTTVDHILGERMQQQHPIPLSGVPEELLPKLRENIDLMDQCFTLDELLERLNETK